ncbi:MAG: putative toxin-antitoxin system toxin component, PIN family [Elusimicrobiota bacterium]
MKSVVIDTNVFISALWGSEACRQIYELLKEDKFHLAISDDLLSEIKRTLNRLKFNLQKEEVIDIAEHIRQKAKKIFPKETILLCRDPKDNIILECALAGKVDFIVTGDKDLLSLNSFRNIPIITPRQFLAIIS